MPILGVVASAKSGNLSGTFDLIQTTSITTNTASVTFSSLGSYSSFYKNLRLIIRAVDTAASNNTWVRVQFNGDTGSNYYYNNIRFNDGNTTGTNATGDSVTSGVLTATRDNPVGGDTTYGFIAVANIANYSSSAYKNVQSFGGQYQSNGWAINTWSSVWKSTSAITSITVFLDGTLNFRNNSVIYLYGMKG